MSRVRDRAIEGIVIEERTDRAKADWFFFLLVLFSNRTTGVLLPLRPFTCSSEFEDEEGMAEWRMSDLLLQFGWNWTRRWTETGGDDRVRRDWTGNWRSRFISFFIILLLFGHDWDFKILQVFGCFFNTPFVPSFFFFFWNFLTGHAVLLSFRSIEFYVDFVGEVLSGVVCFMLILYVGGVNWAIIK